MCKFKSALIAKYKDDTKLFWKFDTDSHIKLSKLLEKEYGLPEAICPIEVTCGKIVIDLVGNDIEPWMRDYAEKYEKEIKDIEIQSLEWMKTHALSQLDITNSVGFVIPKGSKIERIYADNSKNLTFEEPIVVDYLSVNNTENFVIPKGSKIETIYAGNSKNLTLEEPILAEYLDISYTDGLVIPKGSKIKEICAYNSKDITFEDDCEIRELYSRGSSEMIIPSTCKIGRKYV